MRFALREAIEGLVDCLVVNSLGESFVHAGHLLVSVEVVRDDFIERLSRHIWIVTLHQLLERIIRFMSFSCRLAV